MTCSPSLATVTGKWIVLESYFVHFVARLGDLPVVPAVERFLDEDFDGLGLVVADADLEALGHDVAGGVHVEIGAFAFADDVERVADVQLTVSSLGVWSIWSSPMNSSEASAGSRL